MHMPYDSLCTSSIRLHTTYRLRYMKTSNTQSTSQLRHRKNSSCTTDNHCLEMTEPSMCLTPKVAAPAPSSTVSSLLLLWFRASSSTAVLSTAAHRSWSRLKHGVMTRTSSTTNAASMKIRLSTKGNRSSWVAFCRGALAT